MRDRFEGTFKDMKPYHIILESDAESTATSSSNIFIYVRFDYISVIIIRINLKDLNLN